MLHLALFRWLRLSLLERVKFENERIKWDLFVGYLCYWEVL